MDCKLLPVTPDSWRAYCDITFARGLLPPAAPESAVLIAAMVDGKPMLLAGAVLKPLDTRFVSIESFVTNPQAPLRARHFAAMLTCRTARTVGTVMGRTAIARPATKGQARMLISQGFRPDAQAFFAPPGLDVVTQPIIPKSYRPAKKRAPPAPLPAEPEAPTAATVAAAGRPRKRGKR